MNAVVPSTCAECILIEHCFEFNERASKECIDTLKRHVWNEPKREFVLKNLNSPLIEVKHSDLDDYDFGGYKKKCKSCDGGILFVYRDNATFILSENDICPLCGQMYKYTDIEEMRKKDWLAPSGNFSPHTFFGLKPRETAN